MNKRVSKTANFEKLAEIFRKQWSAAKEIKTAKNLFYFYFDFQILGSVGPVKQLIKLVSPNIEMKLLARNVLLT